MSGTASMSWVQPTWVRALLQLSASDCIASSYGFGLYEASVVMLTELDHSEHLAHQAFHGHFLTNDFRSFQEQCGSTNDQDWFDDIKFDQSLSTFRSYRVVGEKRRGEEKTFCVMILSPP